MNLCIELPKLQKKLLLQMNPSVRLQDLKIELCKKLKLCHVSSVFKFRERYGQRDLQLVNTLKQIGLKNGDILIAEVDFVSSKENKNSFGLGLKCRCINSHCYNRNRIVNKMIGVGDFEILILLKRIECSYCPERAMGTNPSMEILSYSFDRCRVWLEGTRISPAGFPYSENTCGFDQIRTKEESKALVKRIKETNWKELSLKVRYL